MSEKDTKELESVLGSTHINEFSQYCKANKDSMMSDDKVFSVYFKELLQEKGISQQMVFLKADIPERYGYKLFE